MFDLLTGKFRPQNDQTFVTLVSRIAYFTLTSVARPTVLLHRSFGLSKSKSKSNGIVR